MLRCTKMNGNGNDFFVVDNMSLEISGEEFSRLARRLCRRRESLGADGILVAEPSQCADFKMRLFNSDGSEGEMCGNGARCIARFAYEKGIAPSADMTFETLGGNVRAVVNGKRAALDLAPVDISGVVKDACVAAGGGDFQYMFLTVGVPHAVIFEKEHSRSFADYAPLGREIRSRSDLFPEGTNVDSCGTGSVASAIAANLLGIAGPRVEVINPGGVNVVTLDFSERGKVYPKLEGAAAMLAEITFLPEALC